MSVGEWGSIGELIAAFATLGTLIYLALQIRQNTNSIQGSTELQAFQQWTDWYARVTADPHLQEIYEQGAQNATMSDADARTLLWLQAEYFCMCEGWFRQYQRGLMSANTWEPLADAAVGLLNNRYLEQWWEQRVSPLSMEFRSYIDQRRAQNPQAWQMPQTKVLIQNANSVKGE